jgi:peroxin-7
MAATSHFRTPFNGYSVKFSPFFADRIAVSASQNFGIVGNGHQYVLRRELNALNNNNTNNNNNNFPHSGPATLPLVEEARFETADGIFDCAWSEESENVLVSASGDGSAKLWDVSRPPFQNPLRSFNEHEAEIYTVSWNPTRKDVFLTASWDDTIKLWNPRENAHTHGSLKTFREHTYCVYAAEWSPHHADVFASVSGDCTLKIWDCRKNHSTLSIPAHDFEVLCVDWNKYNDCVVATGSVDRTVKLWDIRNPKKELSVLRGHGYAVRRVKMDPFDEDICYTASYDMTVAMWNWKISNTTSISDTLGLGGGERGVQPSPLLRQWRHHTEFAVGLDVSVLNRGELASCGWDSSVQVFSNHGPDPLPIL